MPAVTLYSKPNCPLCDEARYHLGRILAAVPDAPSWELREVSILDDEELFAAYHELIPVVSVGGGPPLTAPASLDPARLWSVIGGQWSVISGQQAETDKGQRAIRNTQYAARGGGGMDRIGYWIADHWLGAVNTVVGVFALLPWLAPIFARLGWWSLADPIYTMYMFFCHQLPERAGFIFGYQVAYCYRNTAIYTSVFLAGLLYSAARDGAPWPAWMRRPIRPTVFVLLLLPVAVDGLTHMLGFREDNAWFDTLTGGRFGDFSVGDTIGTLNWWLRVITGVIFGFAVVQFIYPWVQTALNESRSASRYIPQFQQGRV
ncbi:MAG: DUF2085 domain-containing protein [Chloroflexia bacterium]